MGKSARWFKKILGLKKKSSKEKSPGKTPENNQILAKPPQPLNDSARILPPPPVAPLKGESPLPAPPPAAKQLQDRQIQCTEDVPLEEAKHTELEAGDEDLFPKVISQEDLAAVRIQKAFRCYLSRRALRALRSVIRLQALARGHAVRRQAAAALRSVQAIVRVQAIFRGRQVRLSEEGQAIQYLLQRYRQETDSWQLADQEPHQQVYRVNSASTKETDKALAYALQRQVDWSKTKKKPLYIDSALESGSGWGWLQRWTAARPWALTSLEATPEPDQPDRPDRPRQTGFNPVDNNPIKQVEFKPQEEEKPRVFTAPEVHPEVKTKPVEEDDDTPNLEDYLLEVNEVEKGGDIDHHEPELVEKSNGHGHCEEVEEEDEYGDHNQLHHRHRQQGDADEQEHREFVADDYDDDGVDDDEAQQKSGRGFDDEHHPAKEDENDDDIVLNPSNLGNNDDKNNDDDDIIINNNNNGNSPYHLLIPQQKSVPSYMAATQSAKAKARAQSPKSTSPGVKRRFSVSGKASLESSPSTGSATTTPRRLSLPGSNNNNNNNNEGSGSPRRISMSNGPSSRSPQTRSGGKSSASKAQENGVRRSTELRKSFRF